MQSELLQQVVITLVPLLMGGINAFAGEPRECKVTAEYVYVVPSHQSEAEGREIALNRARIQAIEREFGTVVSQNNLTEIVTENGRSDMSFTSIGSSEVKGEWIETLGNPEYEVSYTDDLLTIRCRVRGRIREIVSPPVDFKAEVLCNGITPKFARTDFCDGDDLYVSFVSPVDGYLAIYLRDEARNAFRLLPYPGQPGGSNAVQADRKYLFFSEDVASSDDGGQYVTCYHLTADKPVETNFLYIIFSPVKFSIPVDYEYQGVNDPQQRPRMLGFAEYEKWLAGCRRHDREMRVMEIPVSIRQK